MKTRLAPVLLGYQHNVTETGHMGAVRDSHALEKTFCLRVIRRLDLRVVEKAFLGSYVAVNLETVLVQCISAFVASDVVNHDVVSLKRSVVSLRLVDIGRMWRRAILVLLEVLQIGQNVLLGPGICWEHLGSFMSRGAEGTQVF